MKAYVYLDYPEPAGFRLCDALPVPASDLPDGYPDEFVLTFLPRDLDWTMTHAPTGMRVGHYNVCPLGALKSGLGVLGEKTIAEFEEAVAKRSAEVGNLPVNEHAGAELTASAGELQATPVAVPQNTSEPVPGLSKEDV